ncbi:MAG TPA: radical SAM-associated putative lipoprotein [Paludibacter sp.]|nr:radical SAM-associated putative lipoprotein [Paludibacter sp.]
MRISKTFIRILNGILAGLLVLLGFSNCEPMDEYGVPNADYNLKGKVVDKANAKPIKGIRIGFSPYPKAVLMYGVMPMEYRNYAADTTDTKGEYNFTQKFYAGDIPEGDIPVYVEDIDGNENGLYRDTVINVNFEDATRSGKQKNWYDGKLTLNADIELTKKTEGND